MPDFQSIVNSLLARAAKTDPVMLSILQEIVNELRRQGDIIDPPEDLSNRIGEGNDGPANPPSVTDLDYNVNDVNVLLFWTAPTNSAIFYEIREGTVWDTADVITTTANLSLILAPLSVGSHTFLIKTRDTDGNYSLAFDSVTITIGTINTFGITPQVIDNNVLLRWEEPDSSFKIDYYEIRKNGVVVGKAYSTFFMSTELEAGTYTYGVTAFDVFGNKSPESTITLSVNGPTDYVLRAAENWAKTGTLVNGRFDESGVLNFILDTTSTYQQHFVNNTWLTPQDQVNAGFPRWMQPAAGVGSYEETFDFGTVITNVVINIDYQYEIVSGTFNIGISAEVSTDGITWSSPFTTKAFFVTSMRYVRVKFTFTGPGFDALLKFGNVIVGLSVKEEMDGGDVTCLSSDVGGTFVAFNKAFYDVVSITVAALSTSSLTAIYDFTDVPNPTGFFIYVFNSVTGARVSATSSWKARGIM